jgi:hypothetical protein
LLTFGLLWFCCLQLSIIKKETNHTSIPLKKNSGRSWAFVVGGE